MARSRGKDISNLLGEAGANLPQSSEEEEEKDTEDEDEDEDSGVEGGKGGKENKQAKPKPLIAVKEKKPRRKARK